MRPNVLDEAQSKAPAFRGRRYNSAPCDGNGSVPNWFRGRKANLRFPVALKALGINHKSEAGGVILNLRRLVNWRPAFEAMPPCEGFLCEEMVSDILAELIVGISHHAYGLEMLTIGAGGIYAEILDDSTNLLLPVTRESVLEHIKGIAHIPDTGRLSGQEGCGP